MQERVKTSFIPKASLKVERHAAPKSDPIALVNIVTGAILLVAVVLSVGVFLFERFTIQSIANKEASLERSRAAFEPATIRELSRLDGRIEAGKTLLAGHVALSALFDDLEERTLSSVRFSNFAYAIPTPGRIVLTMSGQATSFNAVALQSAEFSKSAIITDPIFSNVNINSVGAIEFNFTAVVDAARTRYAARAHTAPDTAVPGQTTP